jgi:hypothetical protein
VYKKHYPPALSDEVWRLDKIGKDGAFHKRLNQASIQTVEDFLRLVVMDPQRLRNVISTTLLLAVFHNPVVVLFWMIHSQPTAQNTVATKVLNNVLYCIFQSGLFVLTFSIHCCDLEQVRDCHFCSYCLFLFIHSSSSLLCCSFFLLLQVLI